MTVTDEAHGPAGPPGASDPPDAATWHRLSPRMLLVHPVIEIGRALPALVGIVLAGSSRHHGSWWGPAAAGAVALFSLTRWFTTRLRITPEQVQLRHGLLRRRTIATSRNRIRTVDVTAHLLHRLLGLARVVVGTGINDRKGEGRIVLDGLSAAGAAALRDELLHHRPPAPLLRSPSTARHRPMHPHPHQHPHRAARTASSSPRSTATGSGSPRSRCPASSPAW